MQPKFKFFVSSHLRSYIKGARIRGVFIVQGKMTKRSATIVMLALDGVIKYEQISFCMERGLGVCYEKEKHIIVPSTTDGNGLFSTPNKHLLVSVSLSPSLYCVKHSIRKI